MDNRFSVMNSRRLMSPPGVKDEASYRSNCAR
jgi:hypothetical protein